MAPLKKLNQTRLRAAKVKKNIKDYLRKVDKLVKMEVINMRQTNLKTKEKVEIINGNDLVGQVIDTADPLLRNCIEKIDDMPDSQNLNRVLELKKQVQAGTYNFDENLDIVVDRLLEESSSDTCISYPLCDR